METCGFCGNPLEKKRVTFIHEDEDENKLWFVERVPAEVCTVCGEEMYTRAVTDVLLELQKQRCKPVKTLSVPVFDFDTAARQRA